MKTVRNIPSKFELFTQSFGMVPITSQFIMNGNENMDAEDYIYIKI
jgi:hypothetical protein